jgi:Co/Zn/Cd efflux system component
MINAGTVVFVDGFLIYEGVSRFFHPEPIGSAIILWTGNFKLYSKTAS